MLENTRIDPAHLAIVLLMASRSSFRDRKKKYKKFFKNHFSLSSSIIYYIDVFLCNFTINHTGGAVAQ